MKIKPKPQIMYDDRGNEVGVVLAPHEYEKLVEALEDYQDYETIQQRRHEKVRKLEDVKAEAPGRP